MTVVDEGLLQKVANKIGESPAYAEQGVRGSILTVAAASYGSKPTEDDVTQPTGFDPHAAALFEAVVEAAYLVANADGEFDATEQKAFQHVVLSACGDKVGENQVGALLADLADQLQEDGMDKRIRMVGRMITKEEHANEVLRLAGLLAYVSGGVSDEESTVLEKLAAEFKLEEGAVERTLGEVKSALED